MSAPLPLPDHDQSPSTLHPGAEPDWRKLHPLSIVTTGIRYLRGLILPVAFLVVSRSFSGGREDVFFTFLLPLVIGLGAILFSTAHWLLYHYAITDRELVIRSGVISRHERVVPLERIQSIDLDEAPLERILGLARVRVETAAIGGNESKIEMHSLGLRDAQALRQQLINARLFPADAPVPMTSDPDLGTSVPTVSTQSGSGDLIGKLSTGQLLLAGATSGRIGPAAALAAVALRFGTDIVPESWWERVPWQGATHAGIQFLLVVVVLFGIFAWLLAIGSTVLVYAGFELRRIHDQLVIQHGLLERRRRTIPIRRIQAILVLEALLRQPFGYGELKFESAGQAGGDAGESGILFPFLKMTDMRALIERACPEFALPIEAATVQRLPRRALRRYLVPQSAGSLTIGIVINGILWRWFDGPEWWSLTIFLLVPIFLLLGWSQYHTAGWQVTPVHLLMRWRTLIGKTTMITRRQRLQHRGLTANPFQRRASLVTFHASVASGSSGGHFALHQMDRDAAERLLAELSPPPRHLRGMLIHRA